MPNAQPTTAQECYQRAAECAATAKIARDGVIRQIWIDQERQWISLAQNYDAAEKLSSSFDCMKS